MPQKELTASYQETLKASLLIVLIYVLLRHFIYAALPAISFSAWIKRDVIMSFPRIAGLCASLIFCHRRGGLQNWGWSRTISRSGAIVLLLTTAMYICFLGAEGSRTTFGIWTILIGWASTGPVALFEEAAFRSLMFLSFRNMFAPRRAAILCSLVFMVYHIEAQPLGHWPEIFIFGLAMCAAIHSGTGLPWLIAAHWLVDGVWFHLASGPGIPWAFPLSRILFFTVGIVALAMLKHSQSETSNIALLPTRVEGRTP